MTIASKRISTIKKRKKMDERILKHLNKLISIQPSFSKRKIDHVCISSVCTFFLDRQKKIVFH